MSKYLKGKVIIVTGAASGFGKVISEKCAAGGAQVVGVDVSVEGLNEYTSSTRPGESTSATSRYGRAARTTSSDSQGMMTVRLTGSAAACRLDRPRCRVASSASRVSRGSMSSSKPMCSADR
jgi:hypothetical protein